LARIKALILIVLILVGILPCFSEAVYESKEGFYIDARGQIDGNYIKPPHPENIPNYMYANETVVPFDNYYEKNIEGKRAKGNKLERIPNYNANFSERRAHPYTHDEYVNVWCSGEIGVNGVDCVTPEYAISFFPVDRWSRAITIAALRARKLPQKGAAFLYVEDFGADAGDIYEAKKWADMWGVKVFFGTIDAGIPDSWIR